MKRLVRILAACALVACSEAHPSLEPPSRVIWIAIDALSAKHLHVRGYERETSPFLDSLAAQSVDFALAIAPSNVTPRSVGAYMTGRYFSHLQRDLRSLVLPSGFPTLAEWLREHGFRTVAFNENPLITERKGFARGFDLYVDLLPSGSPKADLDALIAAVERSYAPSAGREFVYVHTMDAHNPYLPPPPYDSMFVERPYRGRAVSKGNLLTRGGEFIFSNLPGFPGALGVSPEDVAFLRSQYDGAIRYTDAKLASLLAALHFDPDSDLLILSADHGEQLFEHGYWLHGRTLLPEEIEVPLLARYAGFAPRVVRQPVSLTDWIPTLAELFGFEPPPDQVGQSLLPVLRGGEAPERAVYSGGHPHVAWGAAVVWRGYLYWLCADRSQLEPWAEWPYDEFLCDLSRDPGCSTDLSASRSELAAEMNAKLRQLNPIWREFESERVRPPEGPVERGPDRLSAAWRQALLEREGEEELTLTPGTALLLQAHVHEPGHRYMLALDFRLRAGALALELRSARTGKVLWHQKRRYASDSWRSVRAALYPEDGDVVLALRLDEGGDASVRSPGIWRVRVPELAVVPWEDAVATPTSARAPDAAEQQRLRALGYLQ